MITEKQLIEIWEKLPNRDTMTCRQFLDLVQSVGIAVVSGFVIP